MDAPGQKRQIRGDGGLGVGGGSGCRTGVSHLRTLAFVLIQLDALADTAAGSAHPRYPDSGNGKQGFDAKALLYQGPWENFRLIIVFNVMTSRSLLPGPFDQRPRCDIPHAPRKYSRNGSEFRHSVHCGVQGRRQ